jgi:predicted transglutaminase-like protease
MAENPSVQLFLRSLEQAMNEFKQSIENLIIVFSLNDPAKKVSLCNEVRQKLGVIKQSLSPQDFPKWLKPLEQELTKYSQNSKQPNSVVPEKLEFLLSSDVRIKSHV